MDRVANLGFISLTARNLLKPATKCCGFHSSTSAHSIFLSHTQGVSRLVDITAGGNFLGLCDKKIHINMCPILDSYGVMGIF